MQRHKCLAPLQTLKNGQNKEGLSMDINTREASVDQVPSLRQRLSAVSVMAK